MDVTIKKYRPCHRRLSILDLDVAANQPMCNEDSSIWVTYNGEIYNHSVIRNELISLGHSFKTNHSIWFWFMAMSNGA